MIKYFLSPLPGSNIDLRFERKTPGASGYDLMANIGMERVIAPGKRYYCPTGLHLEMPIGIEAQGRTRSGICRDHGIIVLNAPGTIDADYRGEIGATLFNSSDVAFVLLPGMRIAQLVFCPVVIPGMSLLRDSILKPHNWEPQRVDRLEDLSDTDRGKSGHGSTGLV